MQARICWSSSNYSGGLAVVIPQWPAETVLTPHRSYHAAAGHEKPVTWLRHTLFQQTAYKCITFSRVCTVARETSCPVPLPTRPGHHLHERLRHTSLRGPSSGWDLVLQSLQPLMDDVGQGRSQS